MCVKEMEKGTTCVHPLFVLVGFACRLIPGASLTHFIISGTHKPARRAGSKLEGFWLLGLQLGGRRGQKQKKNSYFKIQILTSSQKPWARHVRAVPPSSHKPVHRAGSKLKGVWLPGLEGGGPKTKKTLIFSKLKNKCKQHMYLICFWPRSPLPRSHGPSNVPSTLRYPFSCRILRLPEHSSAKLCNSL